MNAWVRITFPADYQVPLTGATCLYEEAGQYLKCGAAESESLELNIHEFSSALVSGATINLLINGVVNPGITGTTGTLTVELLEYNTYLAQF